MGVSALKQLNTVLNDSSENKKILLAILADVCVRTGAYFGSGNQAVLYDGACM